MIRIGAGAAGLGVLALAAMAGAASAADIPVPPEITPAERVEQGWIVTVTPRFWYFLENDVYFQDLDLLFQQSNETIDVPFAGGSISVTPPGLGGTTFSLTALYGEGDGDVNGIGVDVNPGPFFAFPVFYAGQVDMSRLDVEGIAQIPVAEGASAIVGARYINFQRDEVGTFATVAPFGILVRPVTFDLEQNFYLGELGMGVSRPATESGSVVMFGNATAMVGYADVVDFSQAVGVFNTPVEDLEGGVAGIDTNAGVGFKLTDNVLLSGRYRLFYLSNPDFEFEEGGTFIHGPEANLSITFGG